MRVDKTYPGAEITELDGENPQLNPSELSERLKFEILLSDLAVAFIQIPITEIDYEINDWLKRVSEFFACDIIRLFEQFPIDNSMNLIYTYSKPGVDPPAYNSSINYPWVAAQILEGNPCILHSLEDIPEDAIDDRNSFIDRGLKSIIGVPLISGDNVIGGLSIVTVIKERQWTSIEIERVQRIGNVFANIIVRKQSDNVLRDSEEKYHSLVSHIPDVTWSTDINGTTHFISHNIEKIYGYSPAEIYESGEELWFGRIHPEDIDAVRQTFKDIFENNLLLDIEYRIQRKDGRWIWLHDRSTGTYQRNGILYADGVCTDITERKQVEETLRGYEHIVSSSKDMLALLDRNFVYLATNEAYAKAFGKTHGELIGATVSDIFGDTFFETVIRPNAEKCLQGLEVRYQNWFDYPTIGKRYMEITYDPYRGSDNEIKGFVVNGRDITERKRAEEALLSEKLLSEEYINSLPGLFYVFDEQRFVKWNSSEWRRITGYSDEELAGKYGTDFFEGDDKKHIAERMQKTFSEGFADAEAELVTKDGSRIPYFFTGLRKKLNGKDHLIGLGVDITERRQAEETLRGYEHIVSSSKDMLALLDRNFVYLATNETYAKTFGKTRNELIGSTISEIFGNKFFETVIKSNAEKCLLGNEVRYQNWFDFPTLGKRYMEITYDPYRGSDNEIKGFVVNGRDITERKQAQQAVLERERILNQTGRMAKIGGWEHDLITGKAVWTKVLYDLIGLPYDAPAPGPNEQLNYYPEDNRKALEEGYQRAVEKGIPFDLELQAYTVKGDLRWWRAYGEPVYIEGKCVKMQGTFQDITDRKIAEEELNKSELHLSTLVESIPDLIWLKDPHGVYLSCNPKFEQFCGVQTKDIIGKTDYDLVSKEQADFFRQKDKEAIAIGKPTAHEALVTYRDAGYDEYLETIKTPMYSSDGHLIGVLGIARDITERKQAEETLRQNERKFRTYVEKSPTAIFIADNEMRYRFVNLTACKITGYSEHELLNMSIPDITYSEYRNKAGEMFQESLKSGGLKGEVVLKAKDGHKVDAIIESQQISENQHIAFCTDITDLKKLQEERDRILNLSPDLICIASTDGYFKYLNPAWEEIVGYTLDELYSKPFLEFIHPDDHAINDKEVEKLSGGIPTEDFQNRYIHKDGSVRIIQWKASPIQESGLMYCIGRDVTEAKKMEEELTKQSKLESLGILAAGIAHDYNNILVVLMGNVSLSKEFCKGDKDLLQSLEDAEKACERAKDLTHQLFTFARGGAPIKRTLNIVKLIKDTTSFTLRGSNVKYEINCASAEINMLIDEGQISQMINNIVLNARQAMPDGGKIELRIEERELEQDDKRKINAGKHIKIEIEDKGDGIPENILNKIFDPFFTTKEKGTGLGLATSYSIIKNHQGCIFVTSMKGRGTKFTIYLPMTKVVKEETVSEKLSDFKGDGRILVIDDEEAIRLLLKRILTMSGYEVETVSCSEEGFALYREGIIKDNRFSAVIIDLTLPGDESGEKVLKRIKSVDPDVKAIVSSGYSNDPIMANYCDYGFSGILTKPYKADIVRKTLYFILQD